MFSVEYALSVFLVKTQNAECSVSAGKVVNNMVL